MASLDRAEIIRDEYITQITEIDNLLGSVEVISFIQDRSSQERAKFFDLKNEVAVYKSKLVRAKLDKIAFRLEQLQDDFNKGITNINNALANPDNINEILNVIEIFVGILARIFI